MTMIYKVGLSEVPSLKDGDELAATYELPVNEFAVVPEESDHSVKRRPGRPPGITNPNAGGRLSPKKKTVSDYLDDRWRRVETFVRAWEESNSREEVARRLGLVPGTVASKATHYRRLGLELKHMPRNNSVDVGAMNKLIRRIREEQLAKQFDKVKHGNNSGSTD